MTALETMILVAAGAVMAPYVAGALLAFLALPALALGLVFRGLDYLCLWGYRRLTARGRAPRR